MSAPIYDANGNRVRPMTHLDRLIYLLAILCALFWLLFLAAVAFAQTYTITADESADAIFEYRPQAMGSMVFTTPGGSCELDDLFAASDAMLEFFPPPVEHPVPEPAIYREPLTEPQRLRAEADWIERREAAISAWREIAAKCSQIYKTLRDGVEP